MQSYIEIIYIASDDQARQTNMRHAGKSNAATWAAFNGMRRYGVDIKEAKFLIDYHNPKGDFSHTIAVSAEGFTAITGQQPKSEAEYDAIDAKYWDDVRALPKAA